MLSDLCTAPVQVPTIGSLGPFAGCGGAAFNRSTLEADTEAGGSVSLVYIGVTVSQGYK